MSATEFVIRAKVRGACALYLIALRSGTQNLQDFIADLENNIRHRSMSSTAARALAIAIFQAEQ